MAVPRLFMWLAIGAMSGCFNPDPQPGVACGPGDSCAPGMSCVDGFCRVGDAGVASPDARAEIEDGSVDAAADANTVVDAPIDGAPPIDGEPPVDALPGAWLYTPAHFDPSDLPSSLPVLEIWFEGTSHYDTDTAVLTLPDAVQAVPLNSISGGMRVLWTSNFSLSASATLRVEGNLPLLVVSTGDITIEGVVSANSSWNGASFATGAGANPDSCPLSPPDPGGTCEQHGGSGGGAGGFAGVGGHGGEGGDTHLCEGDGVPGGLGGTALPAPPSELRGGCAGRDGGDNSVATSHGRGGAGGGAVHFTARNTLYLSGVIHVGGAGGTPGTGDRAGGGGGGSGGLIGLEANSIDIVASAILAANGGGGGGGCDSAPATAGANGSANATVAAGGTKQGAGGDGGNGGYRTSPGGQAGNLAERGGGGGGGGTGFILLYSPNPPNLAGGATSSPAPIVM